MGKAADGGHEAIVRLRHDEWGADDVNFAMARAALYGYETIIRWCREWVQPM
jgi:hypothetical protein